MRYVYRRRLSVRELVPAVGIAVGAGLAAFYVAKLLLERTPLPPRRPFAPAAPNPLERRPRRRSVEA